MYLIDFLKRTFRKSNTSIIIYLAINIVLISFVCILFFGVGLEASVGSFWAIVISVLLAVVLYAASLAIALSPVGEWYVRLQCNCKELTDQDEIDYLMPIFNEVYAKAKKRDHSISDEVKIFINDDPCPNAFATGRKTVCVTRGLMQMPRDQIYATLGHEFGHLAHKDTDLLLAINVGNAIINGIITFIKISIEFFHIFLNIFTIFMGGDEGWLAGLIGHLYAIALAATVNLLSRLWSYVGLLLCRKADRKNEFLADAFSVKLGYGAALIDLLQEIGDEKPQGIFAALEASHPPKEERIQNIYAVTKKLEEKRALRAAEKNTALPAGTAAAAAPRPAPRTGVSRPVPAGAAAMSSRKPSATGTHSNAPAGTARPAVPKFCPECGTKTKEGSRFCTGCGKKLY